MNKVVILHDGLNNKCYDGWCPSHYTPGGEVYDLNLHFITLPIFYMHCKSGSRGIFLSKKEAHASKSGFVCQLVTTCKYVLVKK